MSGLQSITYQSVVDITKNWVKSNCSNITDYNGMSAAVKNGYSYRVGSSGVGIYTEYAQATSSSPLQAVAASTVDSNMTNLLQTCGANSYLSRNISDDNFLRFINNMVCFCTNRLAFIANGWDNNASNSVKYLVYNPGTSWNYWWGISNSTATNYTIYASDINGILNWIVDSTRQSLRVLQCRYSYSINN